MCGQAPEEIGFLLVERLPDAEGQPPLLADVVHQPVDAVADLAGIVPFVFHQEEGFRFRRDQQVEADFAFPRHGQVAAVHQVAGRGLRGQDLADGPRRLLQALEQQQHDGAMPRQRLRGQGGLGNQGQRSFRARQQPGQVEMVRRQHVGEVVSAAAQRALGLALADQAGMLRQEGDQPIDQVALAKIGVLTDSLDQRCAVELQQLAVGQRDLQAADVTPHRAVLQPAAAGGVAGDHAADGGDGAVGRVGAEKASPQPQLGREPLVDHARLHAAQFSLEAEDAAEEPGEIQHQPGAERFAGHAAAGAVGVHGDVLLGGVLQAGCHVGRTAGADQRQGLDLVNAGVAGVELQARCCRSGPRR